MKIWHQDNDIDKLNKMSTDTMLDHLGIQVTEITDDSLVGTMPVDKRTIQPHRLLHGGASCVLAETLGSIASNMAIDSDKFYAVGQSINANHIRSAKEEDIEVKGVAKPIHLGRQSHVWEINIYNKEEKLVCVSRLTMAILSK
jgi:1,4-dihydroxy-2-naphthoyl-CoA hydrolase